VTWQSKTLRYGGTCDACGKKIAIKEVGWHDAEVKKVRCADCGPPPAEAGGGELSDKRELRPDPVGGSAALREAQSRHDPKWLKGATGEYFMDQSLHRRLNENAIILTDRAVPGTKTNIDHIVVASSGVWIIDSKKWKGKIEYKAESLLNVTMHLYVGGKDRTTALESIYGLVIPVAQIIDDRSVPIHPVLAFIEGDWSFKSFPGLLINKPRKHEGVWISPPKMLGEMINQRGPLSTDMVRRLGARLDEALKPR